MWFIVLERMKKARQPFGARPAAPRQFAAGAVIYILGVIVVSDELVSCRPFVPAHHHGKVGYQNTAGVFSPFLPLPRSQKPFHHIALRIRAADLLQAVGPNDFKDF